MDNFQVRKTKTFDMAVAILDYASVYQNIHDVISIVSTD